MSDALVSPEWLSDHLDDPDVRVIEIAGLGQEQKQAYVAGHIAGAQCWEWKSMLWDSHQRDFPSPADFARRLGEAGISNDTTVVVYGEPVQFGIYAWWTFNYCGHRNVKVLDGARHRWQAQGRALISAVPPARGPAAYRPVPRNEHMRMGRDEVLSALGKPGQVILDGRSKEEYSGERVGAPGNPDTGALRYGRIPGAKHLMFEELLNPDKSFKPAEAMRAIVEARGSGADADVITYCRMSHRATVLYFALTELLGYRKVRVYDGSWTEWGNLVGVPRRALTANRKGSGGRMERLEIISTEGPLGAEIHCGDLRRADADMFRAIRAAWLDHLVVLFRGQDLTDDDLIAFGRGFGDFQYSNPLPSPLANEGKVRQGGRRETHPEITIVSNIVENGVAIGGLGDGELVWHTDMSSFETPPNQTALYAIEVPSNGGQTGFNNMYAAYDTLPQALRKRVGNLQLKHDATIDAAGYIRKNFAHAADADLRTSPGGIHPLVRTHPETGRNCLFLGRRTKSYLMGLSIAESEALLDELWAHATQPSLAWFHEWRPRDLLMWDNRCVMHRREPFDASARRELHRVVIKGSTPYNASEAAALAAHPRAAPQAVHG